MKFGDLFSTWRKKSYWLIAILLAVFQIDLWIAPWPSLLARCSLFGASVISIGLIVNTLYEERHKMKDYWLVAILFAVFQIDFWTAPWPSLLAWYSLIGTCVIVFGLVAYGCYKDRHKIWRVIMWLRRD